ncbi:uncharacterized protein LOC143300811 [Babylonia areolata]|uniref:uncharacterized protein LOC143300811 n=1 Tax=Babylonia areolata TaxID=304850 RepID=UPI003FD43679
MSASITSLFLHNSTYSDISTSPVLNSSETSVPEGCVTADFFEFIPWDNEANLIPKEVDDITNVLLLGIGLQLMFLVSFCTNVINMVVFYKHGLKERINACLFTLSVVDLLSVTSSAASWCDVLYMCIIGKIGQLGPAARFFFRNYLIGLYGFVTSSQIVYSVIALERCLCITRPLLVKTFMSTKTTVVVLWSITVTITKLSQWRESVSSVSDSVTSRDVALTRVIVGTSVLFIACIFPAVVMRISSFLVPDFVVGGRYDNLAWFTRRFYILASGLNSTFNFFLYYAYGSKFRETTNRLLSVWCCVESCKPEHKAK